MPAKKAKAQAGGKRRKRGRGAASQRGEGWIGDAVRWTGKALKTGHDWVKKNKIISRAAPIVGSLTGNAFAGKAIGTAAGALGYGGMRLQPEKMKGSGGRAVMAQ